MRVHLPLAVAGVALAASDAVAADSLLSRTSGSLSRAHHAAIRRSAGLARDLRTAFRGLLVEQHSAQVDVVSSNHVYCVSSPRSTSPAPGGGLTGANGTVLPSGTGQVPTAKATTTKKGSPTATSAGAGATATSQSQWKVFQQYVSRRP
jgi:hypothetical protein